MENLQVVHRVENAMFCMTRQCWEQGILSQAILEKGDYEKLRLIVHDIVLRQSEDGRLCNIENTPAVNDSTFCIPATLAVADAFKEQSYIDAVNKNIDYLINCAPKSENGVIYHIQNQQEIWADSAAFTPLAFALTGKYQQAINQMQQLQKALLDEQIGLYYHVWDDATKAYRRKIFWGIGNGWFLTGMLRLYMALPNTFKKERENLYISWKNLLDTMLSYKTKNNLFYDDMTNEASFEESEVSEMVAYSIYVALNNGLLPVEYAQIAKDIRNAICKKIDENGLVLDCASSPDFVKAGTSVEGQAHFIMLDIVYNAYEKGKK